MGFTENVGFNKYNKKMGNFIIGKMLKRRRLL
jgi:hypothetical protein